MYRLWLADKATWTELNAMSLNEIDLANLALDAWEAAAPKPKR